MTAVGGAGAPVEGARATHEFCATCKSMGRHHCAKHKHWATARAEVDPSYCDCCGHSKASHNDLGYCQVDSRRYGQCGCGGTERVAKLIPEPSTGPSSVPAERKSE